MFLFSLADTNTRSTPKALLHTKFSHISPIVSIQLAKKKQKFVFCNNLYLDMHKQKRTDKHTKMYLFCMTVLYLFACGSGQSWMTPFETFTWFHNSKDFCLTLRPQQGVVPMNTTLLVSYGSDTVDWKTTTLDVGNHACHNGTPILDLCGYLPDDVDSTMTVKPIYLDTEMWWVDPDFPSVTGIISFHGSVVTLGEFKGQTSPVSLGDKCLLYKDKCTKCNEPCSSVRQGKGEVICDQRLLSGDEIFARYYNNNEEMPFLVAVDSVADITDRSMMCITLKRPLHDLGNIFQYLGYITSRLKVVYIDETGWRQVLHSSQAATCSDDVFPMKDVNETSTFCANYAIKPKKITSIRGTLEIQGYNRLDMKYSVVKRTRSTFFYKDFVPFKLDRPDACLIQDKCSENECSQTCNLMMKNNSYMCNGILHSLPITTHSEINQRFPTSTNPISSELTPQSFSIPTALAKEKQTSTGTKEYTTLSPSRTTTLHLSSHKPFSIPSTTSDQKRRSTTKIYASNTYTTEEISTIKLMHPSQPNDYETTPMKTDYTSSTELSFQSPTTSSFSSYFPKVTKLFRSSTQDSKKTSAYLTQSHLLTSDENEQESLATTEAFVRTSMSTMLDHIKRKSNDQSNVLNLPNSSSQPFISYCTIFSLLVVFLITM